MKNICDVDDCDEEAVVGVNKGWFCLPHFDESLRDTVALAVAARELAEESHA